ncbi:MAG: hypothetical protein ACTSW7_02455 [Candidatus Thorarchaeota archaeon]
MEIPENWQEELMLHDWKMMRIERCKEAFEPGTPWYNFPNGIRLRLATIEVDFEKANAVMAVLSDLEPKKKVNKGIATIKLNWDHFESMPKGELEDFKWRIYSLDV